MGTCPFFVLYKLLVYVSAGRSVSHTQVRSMLSPSLAAATLRVRPGSSCEQSVVDGASWGLGGA